MYRVVSIGTFALLLLGTPATVFFSMKVRRALAEPAFFLSFVPITLLFAAFFVGRSTVSRAITAATAISAWLMGLGAYYCVFYSGMHPIDGAFLSLVYFIFQWALAVVALGVALFDRFRLRHDNAV